MPNLVGKKGINICWRLILGMAVACLFLLLVVFPAAISPKVTLAAENYQFVTKWPAELWYFKSPNGVATDSSGNVYVADTDNNRIQKFTSDGTFTASWGSLGDGNGQFNGPRGIAVDSSGYVYVADTDNSRIQKFTSDGTFTASWGSLGDGDSQFNGPQGIAVDSSGYVYVADTNNSRIQKFTSDGTFVATWGTSGIGDGEFSSPRGVAVDFSGNVYVADTYNNRIQKFTSGGAFTARWFSCGSSDGEFNSLYGVAVDSSGYVYVADTYNNRIQKFTSDGVFITKWGTYGTNTGEFDSLAGVTVDFSGNVYVADTYNNRIQKFTSGGTFVATWGTSGTGDGQFNWPGGIAVDSSGNVYVADTSNNRVQKFTSDGTFVIGWGSSGTGDGQFNGPWGIAVDSSGNVYVADTNNNRLQKFTSGGAFIASWGSYGTGDSEFNGPWGIAVDSSSNVYVADTYNDRLQKFTSDGTFTASWGSYGDGNGEFYHPRGIAVDSSGYVYVADTYNNRIQVFEIDSYPPTAPIISSSTHPDEATWYSNNDPSFSWTEPSDLSGVSGYSYELDQISTTIPDETVDTTDISKSYTDVADGTWYFHVRAKDGAENWGDPGHYTVKIDTTGPEGTTVLVEGGAEFVRDQGVTLTLSATDTASGLDKVCFSNDGETYSAWQNFTTSATWTLSSGDGEKTVYAQFRDSAENTSVATDTILLDKEAPFYTPIGTDKTVSFNSGASVTFHEVTSAGYTDCEVTSVNSWGDAPSGYEFIGYFYNFTTTCEYTGGVAITIPYPESEVEGPESDLKLFHWNGDEWEDVTDSVDEPGNEITGSASSFSPFVAAQEVQEEEEEETLPRTGTSLVLLAGLGFVLLVTSLGKAFRWRRV